MQMVYTYKILAFKYVSNQNMFQIDAHTHVHCSLLKLENILLTCITGVLNIHLFLSNENSFSVSLSHLYKGLLLIKVTFILMS